MSLLNFMVWPERALISVDTTCEGGEGVGAYELSKVMLLAHTNVVMALRGPQKLLLEVFAACHATHTAADFDGIDTWLKKSLDAGYEPFLQAQIARGLPEHRMRCGVELVVCGFSLEADQMQATRYARERGEVEFSKRRHAVSLAPDARWDPAPMPDNTEALERIAKDQVAFARREHPGAAIGGRLLVVELTKDTAMFRYVCELG